MTPSVALTVLDGAAADTALAPAVAPQADVSPASSSETSSSAATTGGATRKRSGSRPAARGRRGARRLTTLSVSLSDADLGRFLRMMQALGLSTPDGLIRTALVNQARVSGSDLPVDAFALRRTA